jgi:hypothetical protein
MGKIRYIWKDEDGAEHISKDVPINACLSLFGGSYYTPTYRKVVVIEIEEEE